MKQIEVKLLDSMGNDRAIAESAWTSSTTLEKKEGRTDADVERVVIMLAKERHGTPFESVIFKFWYNMPIFIDRQHMTYRNSSQNGISARYRILPTDYYELPTDVRKIIKKANLKKDYDFEYFEICESATQLYKELMTQLKICEKENTINLEEYKRVREVFRGVLPQSLLVERVSIFNLRSLSNYFKQRISDHAQKEIRFVAESMLRIINESNICPIAIRELEKNSWEI